MSWWKRDRVDDFVEFGIHWFANRKGQPGWEVIGFAADGDTWFVVGTYRWRWRARLRAWVLTRSLR